MKIHLSKSGQINSDGGEYIAALLNKYTQEHIQIPNSFKLRSENSISYDVFRILLSIAQTVVKEN